MFHVEQRESSHRIVPIKGKR